MKLAACGLILLALFTGCASTSKNYSEQDFGPKPEANEAEKLVLRYLERTLKDPISLRDFRILSPVRQGQLNYGAFNTGPLGKSFGNPMWFICAEYNAKNSYGGYVGIRSYAFFIHSGRIERAVEGLSDGGADFGNTKFDCT